MQNFRNFFIKHKTKIIAVSAAVIFLAFGLFLDFAKSDSDPSADRRESVVTSQSDTENDEDAAESNAASAIESESGQQDEGVKPSGSEDASDGGSAGASSQNPENDTADNKDPVISDENNTVSENPNETTPADVAGYCTISISCASILDHMDEVKPEKQSIIPKDGWILQPVKVSVTEGESVFDVLKRVCRERKIPFEFSYNAMFQTAYIEGISNIYEFDAGSQSGWKYKVDGVFPNYGCSAFKVKDGQKIEWVFTYSLEGD